VITIHQRYRQTDGQTDRQTTCDRNTALCTKVHRAVIKAEQQYVWNESWTVTTTEAVELHSPLQGPINLWGQSLVTTSWVPYWNYKNYNV